MEHPRAPGVDRLRTTAATRRVSDGSLTHRIALPGRDDEFRRLADSFDGMLPRLENQMAVQRRSAANASHELRAPLAITQTLLDVARDDPDADPAALIGRLEAVNRREVDFTEALLALSRADQGAGGTHLVDRSLLAEEAVETLLPSADDRGLALVADGDARARVPPAAAPARHQPRARRARPQPLGRLRDGRGTRTAGSVSGSRSWRASSGRAPARWSSRRSPRAGSG